MNEKGLVYQKASAELSLFGLVISLLLEKRTNGLGG